MQTLTCEVLVVGGGAAGCAAALVSARAGADTILLERYGCVGGGLTNMFVRPFLGWAQNENIGREIEARVKERESFMTSVESAKHVLPEMLAEAGVRVMLQCPMTAVRVDGDRIASVIASFHGVEYNIHAKMYIDATGDGDLSALSGCEVDMGRDGDRLVQPVSCMFTIENIDPAQDLICYSETHETILSTGEGYLDLCHKAAANGELPPQVDTVRLYDIGIPTERMVNASQENYIDPLDPTAVFRAEIALRRQTTQIVEFLKHHVPGYENIRVSGSAVTLGIRESRRVMGDYVLSLHDLKVGSDFDDAVVRKANFCIDIHNPDGAGQAEKDDEAHVALDYDIPYRCLTPRGKSNLLTAGRCISGSHHAHASYRVMRICMAMGHAAGAAAYLALETGDTRKINIRALQKMVNIEIQS